MRTQALSRKKQAMARKNSSDRLPEIVACL